MIEPTDEMVTVAAEVAEEEMIRRIGRDLGTIHRDDIIRAILKAGLAIAERQAQEQYGDAYQRGWWAGQHRLCPRCGVALEREVASERQERQPDGTPRCLVVAGSCPGDANGVLCAVSCVRETWT